jgi:hypothetical protein
MEEDKREFHQLIDGKLKGRVEEKGLLEADVERDMNNKFMGVTT